MTRQGFAKLIQQVQLFVMYMFRHVLFSIINPQFLFWTKTASSQRLTFSMMYSLFIHSVVFKFISSHMRTYWFQVVAIEISMGMEGRHYESQTLVLSTNVTDDMPRIEASTIQINYKSMNLFWILSFYLLCFYFYFLYIFFLYIFWSFYLHILSYNVAWHTVLLFLNRLYNTKLFLRW